uniref:Uncharacterized protein n=1 Tax=Cucumis melo TaxID=3656 RepID=A0A9I9EA67_CUCME
MYIWKGFFSAFFFPYVCGNFLLMLGPHLHFNLISKETTFSSAAKFSDYRPYLIFNTFTPMGGTKLLMKAIMIEDISG